MIGQGANDPRVKQAGAVPADTIRGSAAVPPVADVRLSETAACSCSLTRICSCGIESDQIFKAAKAKGLDVKYYLYTDEGHGFARPSNR